MHCSPFPKICLYPPNVAQNDALLSVIWCTDLAGLSSILYSSRKRCLPAIDVTDRERCQDCIREGLVRARLRLEGGVETTQGRVGEKVARA